MNAVLSLFQQFLERGFPLSGEYAEINLGIFLPFTQKMSLPVSKDLLTISLPYSYMITENVFYFCLFS